MQTGFEYMVSLLGTWSSDFLQVMQFTDCNKKHSANYGAVLTYTCASFVLGPWQHLLWPTTTKPLKETQSHCDRIHLSYCECMHSQILLALRLWPFNPVCHHHHCLLLVHATCPICLLSTISSLCILCTSIIYANIIPYMIHSGQSQGSWTAAHIAINICVPSQGLYLMICPQFQRLMLILITLSLIMQISCWVMLESSMKQGNQEAQQLKSQTEASDDRFRPAVGCRWAACVMSARAQATGVCNSTLQWHSESV